MSSRKSVPRDSPALTSGVAGCRTQCSLSHEDTFTQEVQQPHLRAWPHTGQQGWSQRSARSAGLAPRHLADRFRVFQLHVGCPHRGSPTLPPVSESSPLLSSKASSAAPGTSWQGPAGNFPAHEGGARRAGWTWGPFSASAPPGPPPVPSLPLLLALALLPINTLRIHWPFNTNIISSQ